MTTEAILRPARRVATQAIAALQNGRPTSLQRHASALRMRPPLPTQLVSGSTFIAESKSDSVSATLRTINASEQPPERFVACTIQTPGLGPKLRIARSVLDGRDDVSWNLGAEAVGDMLARNLRVVKHSPIIFTVGEGDEEAAILSDRIVKSSTAFQLIEDILSASGLTKSGQGIKMVLPTGTRPIEIETLGFCHPRITELVAQIGTLLHPSLHLWSPAKSDTVQITRVHAHINAEGVSPMGSLRSTEKLISILGLTKFAAYLLD